MYVKITVNKELMYKGANLSTEEMVDIQKFLEDNIDTCTYLKFQLNDGNEIFLPGNVVRSSVIHFINNHL